MPDEEAGRSVTMAGPRSGRIRRYMYLWHPDLHRDLANEQLVFMLLGFDPIYRRATAVSELKNALTRLNVRSYAVWELIGEHDLIVQAWLPRGVTVPRVEATLSKVSVLNFDVLSMSVDEILYHWMWPQPFDVDQLDSRVRPGDYADLNGDDPVIPQSRIQEYEALGVIHKTPVTKDMKFFLRVTNPYRAPGRDGRARLRKLAQAVVNGAGVTNGVVLQVSGDGGSYLITGRIRPSNYENIALVLRETLGNDGLLDSLNSRTVTHISAFANPLDRREQLLPPAEANPHAAPSSNDLDTWLKLAESDELEFKGSAFTDLYYKIGRRGASAPSNEATPVAASRNADDQVRDIAKAVAGMLNAIGGTVVIGVAEVDKLNEARLREMYPQATVTGNWGVIGIDGELKRGSWDAYQRFLASKLRSLITGELGGRLRYHRLDYNGYTVCVLKVQRSSSWHWVKSKDKSGKEEFTFFGREGGETRTLTPPQAEEFKQAHPRISRSGSPRGSEREGS